MSHTDHQVEHYGPVHLHPNVYPIHANEQELHMCGTGMYPCDDFPGNFVAGEGLSGQSCTPRGPQAINNSTNPAERYGHPGASTGNVGVGCMNLNCMAPNCHGTVNCTEGFVGGLGLPNLDFSQLIQYIVIGFLFYYLYCMVTGKKLF